MTMLELVKHLNFAVVVLFTLLYLYQGFYVVVGGGFRPPQGR